VAQVIIPSVLAAQAGGRARFDITDETLGDALRALPVADLLFDAHGEWRRHLMLYVDGEDARERGGMDCALAGVREVRIVGMISGG